MAWYPVARLDELAEGRMIPVEVEGEEIALGLVDGEPFAVGNVCSHAYARLSEGRLEGHVLTCPRHGGQFDVRTGKALRLPAVSPIPVYPVRRRDGQVWVAFEDPEE